MKPSGDYASRAERIPLSDGVQNESKTSFSTVSISTMRGASSAFDVAAIVGFKETQAPKLVSLDRTQHAAGGFSWTEIMAEC